MFFVVVASLISVNVSPMANRQSDYPVLIPYSELCELLQTAQLVKEYKIEVEKFRQQVLALRIMQQECFEKLRELEKLL